MANPEQFESSFGETSDEDSSVAGEYITNEHEIRGGNVDYSQSVKFVATLRELKNSLAVEMLNNFNKEMSSRMTLQVMLDGELDFDTFRRAIRVNSTRRSNSQNLEAHHPHCQTHIVSVACCSDTSVELQSADDMRRQDIIKKIEDIVKGILKDIMQGKNPQLTFRNPKLWTNCLFDEIISLKDKSQAQAVVTNYGFSSSRNKFVLIFHLLSVIQKMVLKKTCFTRRELYYQNLDKVRTQAVVDAAIRDICALLEVPPWELGILASSKGLVAGDVEFTSASGEVISCRDAGGCIIAQDVYNYTRVKSKALFILVVEKDAIFQKLLDEGFLNRLGPCILITGKGYPDICTRLMLKLLVDNLKIPSFALVDADPHGIEIMCTYRFGSLAMSHLADRLAVPSLRWLGIHPTDIPVLDAPCLPLTHRDVGKVKDILSRPYCEFNNALDMQLKTLFENRVKCEIEGVATMSQAYLTDRYIPHKICAKDLI